MSNGRYHDEIKALLEKNGAMGVNQIAKELDVPLSTMQKYLDKQQTYFKKNNQRKWVLPEVAANNEMSTIANNVSSIIDSQLMSMDILIQTLMTSFKTTASLIESNKPVFTSVAGKSLDIHKSLHTLQEKANTINDIIKKNKANIPEEYQDLVFNYDYVTHVIAMGEKALDTLINEDLYAVLSGRSSEFTDETVKILEDYQKEA